jgi:2-polyprenyl-3-methyl-5-hydroxy-6-metoxy-1,4-benzoquinol methylase/glycosyltransferase involved in cell wall biosynthesis
MPNQINDFSDLLASIPMNAKRILEVACGDGRLGRAVKARNPQVEYFGVEQSENEHLLAQTHLNGVIYGNIETDEPFASLQAMSANQRFDVIILNGVLEHLLNPWGTLEKLRSLASQNGVCVVCTANIGHWSILIQQLRGRWDYKVDGPLRRQQVRFFTRETTREILANTGWSVYDTKALTAQDDQTSKALGAFEPLLASQGLNIDNAKQDLSATHWIVAACNGEPAMPIHVAALAIRKMAGVNEARVDYPLTALNSLPNVRAVWDEGSLAIPKDFKPGVLILHRQFLNNTVIATHVERLIAQGWVVISEIDDDPSHWRGYVDSDFIAFRGVHGVSVSTEKLAARMRPLNPNTIVFPNAIFQLPTTEGKPSQSSGRIRLFFGALNRLNDWNEIKANLIPALEKLQDEIEFVIVHDQDIHNSLPPALKKEFYPTLPPADYLKVMASCDIALLPLRDTAFNHLKSDIKLIECCACGVVPIFSDVVYADTAQSESLGVCLKANDDWGEALVALVKSPQRLADLRAAGIDYVSTSRMHAQSLAPRLAWLKDIIANKGHLEVQRKERLMAMGLLSLVVDA